MRLSHALAAVALLGVSSGWSAGRADPMPGVAEYSLGDPTFAGPVATFDVGLFFHGFAGYGVYQFGIDVSASSPSLAGGPVPYSAFTFTPDPVLLPGWQPTSGFGNPAAPGYLEYRTTFNPLTFGDNHLGQLSVDLGFISESTVTVSIAGAMTAAVGGQFDDDPSNYGPYTVQFNPGSQTVPAGFGTPGPVPAPPSVLLLAAGGLVLAGRRVWRRVRGG